MFTVAASGLMSFTLVGSNRRALLNTSTVGNRSSLNLLVKQSSPGLTGALTIKKKEKLMHVKILMSHILAALWKLFTKRIS